jgi:tetratricopeptide (TPR) repeat protein
LRRPSPGGRDATLPRRIFLAAGAIAASLAANLVHAFVDFVWYVPGCMVLVAIFAACACRLRQMAAQQVENTNTGPARTSAVLEYPRYVAVAVVGLLAFGGLWLTFDLPSRAVAQIHWERYQRLTRRAGQVSNLTVPSDRSFPLARHIAELETVVRWNPDHARAHLRLAEAYLQRFEWLQQSSECAMPLSQIGDAATYGGFTTREEAERWLSQVLGERRADLDRARRHVLTGLRLSPLQGEGYVYLAELRPLEGPGAAAVKPALMSQALAVRPFDGDVLLQAGRAASLAGDLTLAIQHWQRSFRAGPLHRQQIVALLAERVPVAFFLDAFGPDQTSLRDMHDWYVKLEGPAEAQRLCGLYRQLSGAAPPGDEQEPAAAAAWLRGQVTQIRQRWVGMAEEEAARTTGPKAAVAWLTAASIHRLQKDRQAEFRCAESALRCDPGSLAAHLAMAECLIAAGRCADAGSHLSWCLERRPNDSQLRAMLRATVTKRLDQEGRAASAAAGTRR